MKVECGLFFGAINIIVMHLDIGPRMETKISKQNTKIKYGEAILRLVT